MNKFVDSLPVVTAAAQLSAPGSDGHVQCLACAARCRLSEGQSGACRVRAMRGGELVVPWGYVAAAQIEPVEKKPFFHVLPASRACGFGTFGCNLRCAYCQNWLISQAGRDPGAISDPHAVTPEHLVSRAADAGASLMVATYNEPLVFAEWAAAVFREARRRGLMTGIVSNGAATIEVLEYLRPWVDLMKIDLKCFTRAGYSSLGGRLEHVLEGIRFAHALGFWLEIVTVVIPGFNDSAGELSAAASFLARISPDIPWHVSAFHRDYRMHDPRDATADDLTRAAHIGSAAGLHYVYASNLAGHVGTLEDTRCARCGAAVIQRRGYRVLSRRLSPDGSCPECGYRVPGRWQLPAPAEWQRTSPSRIPVLFEQ